MLNYKMITYMINTNEGNYWVAEYPAITGVLGTSRDLSEAISDLRLNAMAHIDLMNEIGLAVPKEDALDEETSYSGRITVRTSKLKHRQISEIANQQGVSISQWINDAISVSLGIENYKEKTLLPILSKLNKSIENANDRTIDFFNKSIRTYKDDSISNDGYVVSKSNNFKKYNLNSGFKS